jgi:signal peptidase II
MSRPPDPEAKPAPLPGRKSPGTYQRLLLAAAAVVGVDQLTKSLAMDRLADGRTIDVIADVLTLRLTLNSGGAFGVGQGFPLFFLAATVLVVALILLWVRSLDDRTLAVPLGLVLGGGVGNAVDRLLRDTGGRVVDFIDLHVWPVFNVADASITVGVVVILWLTARSGARLRTSNDSLRG